MKRKCILLSLLAVFLFSCHNESSEFIPEKDPEITQLEQKYGVNFKKITDETDTLNSIFIPFEDIEQLLEENIISRSGRPSTNTYTGRGSASVGGSCSVNFDNIRLGKYSGLSLKFVGGVSFPYFTSGFITKNSYLDIYTISKYLFTTKLYHLTTENSFGSRVYFNGTFNLNINTQVGNTKYELSGSVTFELDMPERATNSFSAKLKLTCYF